MTPVEQITSLYIGYFGRAPDPEGLNYWVGRLADGFSLAEIAESFSVQPESTSKYPYLANPNIASPQAFITQVYMNLFNRVPDAEGLAYWTAELANGADVGDFILNVISGAVTAPDSTIIENKIEVGAYAAEQAANTPNFVYDADAQAAAVAVIDGVDATDASVVAAKAEVDAFLDGDLVENTVVLTTAVDNAIGTTGNDQFNGVVATAPNGTFNTGDTISGGGGQDVLSLIVTDGTTVVPAGLTGVERIEVQALASNTINLSNAVGVETLAVGNTATGATTNFTNVNAIADIEINETGTGSSNIVVQYNASVIAGTADVQNVSVEDAAGTVVVDGVEIINVTATGDNALTLSAADLETVNVDGAGDIAFGAFGAGVTTFDASEATGDISATFNAGGDVAVTGGSGDDAFTFGLGLTAADDVDGGEGFDTVTVSNVGDLQSAAEAARFNALTSVERVEFNSTGFVGFPPFIPSTSSGVTLNGATFTNAGITNILFNTDGFLSDDVVNNAGSARDYEFGTENAGSATFNMNGTSTTLNITLLGGEGGSFANIDNVNVALSGTQPTTAVSTINIDSVGDLDDGFFNDVGTINARAGSTINITGEGNLDIAGLTNSGTINASAATGNLVIEGSEATAGTVNTGAGEATGADIITLGAGQDTVQFSSALDSGLDNTTVGSATGALFVDVINSFTAGANNDVLDFTGTATIADYTAISNADQAAINQLSGAAANLQAAADIASLGAADQWTAFTFQGQTYALYNGDATADYTAGTDLLVQITGVTVANLTDANFA